MFLNQLKINLLSTIFILACVTACQAVHMVGDKSAQDKERKGNQQHRLIEQRELHFSVNSSSTSIHKKLKNNMNAKQPLHIETYQKENLILEVAPKPEFCSSGINQECLKVRTVRYVHNQLLATDDWRLMKQPIKGYKHDPKIRTILKIRKVITDPVEVKGKQLTYILEKVLYTKVVDTH